MPRGVSRLTNFPQAPGRCWICHSTSKLVRLPRRGTLCWLCREATATWEAGRVIEHVNMLDAWDRYSR
jgi:hypothetical protein